MQRQTATLQKTQLTGESVDAYLPNLYLAFRHTNSQHSTLDGWQRTTRNKTNPKSSCAGARTMCTHFARNLILARSGSLAVTNDSVEDTRGFVSRVGRQVVLWNTKHSSTSDYLVKQGKLSVSLNVRAYSHLHRTFALPMFYKPSPCQCNLISAIHANR